MNLGAWGEARRRAREQGDFSALIALIPYAGFLGVQVRLEEGEPRFRLPYRPSFIGAVAAKRLHGGVTAGFLENAATLHLLLTQDEPRVPKSIDFSIDYLRGGEAAELHASCSLVRQGRRVALVQVRCWQDDSREVALARVHFLLSNPAGDGT